jgi:soluble lytic murein transglycosylase-like protein
VSRCKSLIAVAAILLVATVLAAAALPQKAEAITLKGKLRAAKRALRHSNHRLKAARTALAVAVPEPGLATTDDSAASPSPSPSPTPDVVPATPSPSPSPAHDAVPVSPAVAQLQARVAKARRAVRIWRQRVRRLERQYRRQRQMADWERRGKWKPIIEIAAARYHVKADGIYRIMLHESGGRRYAGSGTAFKGLFQYWTGTWSASWNPWRHDSIYDGSSQIFATCYAVSRGMGPRMWTTTFASEY